MSYRRSSITYNGNGSAVIETKLPTAKDTIHTQPTQYQKARRHSTYVSKPPPVVAKRTGTVTNTTVAASGTACLASIAPLLAWLKTETPCFRVRGEDVQVLYKPSKFYHTIKSQIRKAKRRIVIASLYLGTGPLEKDLVDCLQSAITSAAAEGRDLSITILLDYQRGSRGATNSSCTMLQPLIDDIRRMSTVSSPATVSIKVALYHTPDLRGLLKMILPERVNEVVGVSHLKVYLFDDNVIMSGANLSDSYFTNRQDRYVLFSGCQQLADFFANLVTIVASLSFQLVPGGELVLREDLQCHPFEGLDNGRAFRTEAARRMKSLLDPSEYKTDVEYDASYDTYVYPLVQMKPLGITQDNNITTRFLSTVPKNSLIRLATGYFNLTDHYCNTILHDSYADYSVLTASPQANGFYEGHGMSGHIPSMYTHLVSQFQHQILETHATNRVYISEYEKEGWTFHGKGIWCYLPDQILPSITFVGSPNFGYRSVFRDLEAQTLVVTSNTLLQEQLHKEQELLFLRSYQVDAETFKEADRLVPLWVKIASYFIHTYF